MAAPLIIAHRGASRDAPENTLAAFRLAWQQGADGIEGDFHLTRDGQIVCVHDDATGRVGDKNLDVSASTYAALRSVDVGVGRGDPFRGERIPTLAETLAEVPPGKRIFIEIKSGPEIFPILEKNLATAALADEQIAILAFDEQVVARARRALPRIRAYRVVAFQRDAAIPGHLDPELDEVERSLKRIGASGLDFSAEARPLDAREADRLRAAGFELHCWTVDDEPLARYCQEIGVKSITTNRPADVRRWLAAGPKSD